MLDTQIGLTRGADATTAAPSQNTGAMYKAPWTIFDGQESAPLVLREEPEGTVHDGLGPMV
jgi:hypothetical protein